MGQIRVVASVQLICFHAYFLEATAFTASQAVQLAHLQNIQCVTSFLQTC